MPTDIALILIVNGICLVVLALGIYGMHLIFNPIFTKQDREFKKYAKLRKDRDK